MADEDPDRDGVVDRQRVMDFHDPGFVANPQPVYRSLHEACGAARTVGDAPLFVVSRYRDVWTALRDAETFSVEIEAPGIDRRPIPHGVDPPEHARYRGVLDPLFSRARIAALEDDLRTRAARLIDTIAGAGHCDYMRDFAVPFPCCAFLQLLGLPVGDLQTFLDINDALIRPHTFAGTPEDCRRRAYAQLCSQLEKVVHERESHPADDWVTHLLQSNIDGTPLSRDEVLNICAVLFMGGLDTVTAALGCLTAYLAAHPAERACIVDDPRLIPAAIEELLRWETPIPTVARRVKSALRVADVEIPEGALVSLVLGAANTDQAQFPNPDTVDFGRRRNPHLAFGGGPHRCLGLQLARLELRIAMEEWHRRIPHYDIRTGFTLSYRPVIRKIRQLPLVWSTPGSGTRSST